jgi:hypothetical protein
VALTATGVAGSYGVTVQGSATSGNSFGLLVQAGTTSADQAFAVLNTGASIGLFRVFGDGSFNLGFNGSAVTITGATAGNVTIAAPGSGNTLTVSGSAIQFVSKTTVARGSGSNWIDFQDPTGESGYVGFGAANNNFYVQNLLSGSLLLGTNNTAGMITIASAGNVTIAAPSSGTGLTVSSGIEVTGGVASTLNIDKTGGSATHRLRLFVGDGTGGTVADDAYISGLNTTIHFWTGGSGTTDALDIGSAGNVTIAAPSSGTGLTSSGASGSAAFLANSSGTTVASYFTFAQAAAGKAFIGVDGSNTLLTGSTNSDLVIRSDVSGAIRLTANAGSSSQVTLASTGAVTIAAPSGGQALTVTGVANQYTVAAQGSATSGQSYGLLIQAGTTSGDQALAVLNTSAAAALFRVFGDGGVVVGNPTGGDQGAGTINVASGYYVNGFPLPVNTSGSFTGTLTGCATSPTATFNWERTGNIVTIYCAAGVTATSNAATMTITGTNAPSSGASSGCSVACFVEDNGTIQLGSGVQPNGGNLTFGKGSSASGGFTSSGTKGLPANWTITYCV